PPHPDPLPRKRGEREMEAGRHEWLLVAQGFDRVEPGGAPGRVKSGKEREGESHDHDGGDLAGVDVRRNAGEEIDFGGKQIGADDSLDYLPDRFDVVGEDEAEDKPGDGADDSDAGAAQHEDAQIIAREAPIVRRIAKSSPLVFHIMIMLDVVVKRSNK